MRFRRALDANVTEALSAASELQFVSLAEALELTLLLADLEPGKFERAATRWHLRFVQEIPHVDLRESLAVLTLLAAIPANRRRGSACRHEQSVSGHHPELSTGLLCARRPWGGRPVPSEGRRDAALYG